jgi:D-glycero-beta-D-manno-heptose 1-phosphate adenylyltransferase
MYLKQIQKKIFRADALANKVESWKKQAETLVFTNGCFDILHAGHVDYLFKAASLGDRLIIGLNSDQSVKRLKGSKRPLQNENNRQLLLAALSAVSAVVIFDEDTPYQLIKKLQPHILVKGGDYQVKDIVGGELVMQSGGSVAIIPFVKGQSSSGLISKLEKL